MCIIVFVDSTRSKPLILAKRNAILSYQVSHIGQSKSGCRFRTDCTATPEESHSIVTRHDWTSNDPEILVESLRVPSSHEPRTKPAVVMARSVLQKIIKVILKIEEISTKNIYFMT